MKPKTKLQFEVIENSKRLDKNDNDMLAWAKVECLDHRGYATKSRVICMDCGQKFSPDLVIRKRAICPHCGTKIKVEQSRKRTDEQRTYIAYAEIYGDFQVIRNFELFAYYKADAPARYHIAEILQHWILPNGKREVVSRNHTINWYCDSWNGNMEIRRHYPRYYESTDRYDVYPYKYHPDSVFKREYEKYGINKNLEGLTFLEAIKFIPQYPSAETLLKRKQYGLLGYAYNHCAQFTRFWPSIKVCLRNNYKIKDVKIWFDYLELLQYLGKDLHNAHYVCPKNLKKEHDKLVEKKRSIQIKQEAERRRLKMLQDEKTFRKLRAGFFGIAFSSKAIEVRMLESVKDVMEEGDILHHCVFTNEYYLKPDSLILSAMVKGKRTETIEISLKQMKVVQCRGLQNQNSKYHDRIIELVNRNMHLIKERLKPKKKMNAAIKNVSQVMQAAV